MAHLPPTERVAALERHAGENPPWWCADPADVRWLCAELRAAWARVGELEKEHYPLMKMEQLPDGTFKITKVEE